MTPAVFAHGHLRLYLLSLLEGGAKHGYELIQALEERFGGTYTPSAGTIYPRLAKLESEGLVSKSAAGRKTVYAITPAGTAELESRRSELDDIESDVTDSVRRLANDVRASVNEAMKSLRADLASAARDARATAATETVSARSESRALLHDAELTLSEFRQDIRAELRSHMEDRELSAATVSLLKQQLRDAHKAVKQSLKDSR
jgi:DNA-binding PadR family transcriptional regulator